MRFIYDLKGQSFPSYSDAIAHDDDDDDAPTIHVAIWMAPQTTEQSTNETITRSASRT